MKNTTSSSTESAPSTAAIEPAELQPGHLTQTANDRPRWRFVAAIIATTIIIKLIPYCLSTMGFDVERLFSSYPWGFSPIYAFCVFGGAIYQSRWSAMLIPALTWLAGDIALWAITGHADWVFHSAMPIVYGTMLACAAIGFTLRNQRTWGRVTVAGFASCLTFFLVTNFATWVGSQSYPQTMSGLLMCYAAGIPFLKNSLLSTAIFGAMLFSPYGIRQPAKTHATRQSHELVTS